MALTTFSTTDQVRAFHKGVADTTAYPATTVAQSRETAFTMIVTALTEGGYSVAAIVAAPTTYPFLTTLEVRLVAVDLLGGAASSTSSKMGGKNWDHWATMTQSWLDGLTAGKLALVDSSGTITQPPKGSAADPGILYEERNSGITLEDPEYWDDVDDLEEWD